MSLQPGQTLGPYRLLEKIGEGGMGVVWRASDAALDREVAIKVLPEGFAGDAERLARFEREAKLLASLSHPNIATVHGLHQEVEARFLAMELVRGEDLARRISRGPLPVEDAMEVGRQVADALEAAHEHGVVHRDLKPANIIIAPDGTAKVLDFGLAKAFEAGAASGDPSLSPTLTHPGTAAGIILGTAAYMSPEQARGRSVDRRADIWAFGCVLHECLTGKRCFSGETISDTLAAVLRAEVDWDGLPASTPPAVAALLRRCLDRDPRRRLRDIGEARVLLESPREHAGEVGALVRVPRRGRLLLGAALALALAVGAAGLGWGLRPSSPPALRKYILETAHARSRTAVDPSLSPDGRWVARVENGVILVRDLSQLEERRLEGPEAVQMLAWSPDSAWLAFASGTRLNRMPIAAGAPQVIGELPGRPSRASGAAWLPDGSILLTTGGSGILSVPSQGGDPVPVLDPLEGENDFHDLGPLPDGRGVVFVVHRQRADMLAVFDGRRRTDVLQIEGEWLSSPAYSPSGHLLYDREGTTPAIWAVPFSLEATEVTGEPFLVASNARLPRAGADGTLLYIRTGRGHQGQLAWLDRSGSLLETLGEPRTGLAQPALSPDGRRVAAVVEEQGDPDIWVLDVSAGSWNRLTFTPDGEGTPRWFPAGDRLAFRCDMGAVSGVCAHAADGTGETEVLVEGADAEIDVSPDGLRLVYDAQGAGTRIDLWVKDLDGEARPLLATTDYESSPRLSPDGRLLAHVAWSLGEEAVYLREFPGDGGKWQISSGSGIAPAWAGDELFFLDGETLVARRIDTKGGVRIGPERRLFDLNSLEAGYDVSRDGQRVLAVRPVGEQTPDQLVLVLNWFEEFAARERAAGRASGR